MSKVAVIGVFYKRPEFIPVIAERLRKQTKPASETFLVAERREDFEALAAEDWGPGRTTILLQPVARNEDGRPLEVPPSVCINAALDLAKSDYIVYLADDSLPGLEKFERMAARLDEGADVVYCSQDRGTVGTEQDWLTAARDGSPGYISPAHHAEDAPWCKVDMTQVMHRRCDLRWTTDMQFMRIGDAEFFNALRDRFGAFQPVYQVLDWHRQLPSGITAAWN